MKRTILLWCPTSSLSRRDVGVSGGVRYGGVVIRMIGSDNMLMLLLVVWNALPNSVCTGAKLCNHWG